MGFNLRNWLEESIADVNPFDNGATAQTVRANRVKAQPAQTVNKQQIQNRPMFQQNNQPAFTQQKQFKIQTQSPTINVNNSMPKVQTFGQSSDPLKVGQVKTPQIQLPVQQPTALQITAPTAQVPAQQPNAQAPRATTSQLIAPSPSFSRSAAPSGRSASPCPPQQWPPQTRPPRSARFAHSSCPTTAARQARPQHLSATRPQWHQPRRQQYQPSGW